jgi:hypothetical protein
MKNKINEKARHGVFVTLQPAHRDRLDTYRRAENLTTLTAAIMKLAFDRLDAWEFRVEQQAKGQSLPLSDVGSVRTIA